MRLLYLCFLLLAGISNVAGQVAGDYQSTSSGDWNDVSTWENYNGTSWTPAVSPPTSANGTITILGTHIVTIPSGFTVTADQLVILNDLIVSAGGQLTLVDGVSTDLTATTASSLIQVAGSLQMNNGATIDNSGVSSRLVFQSGSTYIHNYTTTFGTLPTANWHSNSTVRIQGFTNVSASPADNSWSQSLGNVVYNCTAQTALADFAGNLTSITGDFTISSTGTNVLQLSTNQNPVINITGDLTVSGTSRVNISTTGTGTEVNIGENWNQVSTHLSGSYLTYTGTCQVTVGGDFLMNTNTGRLHLANVGTTGLGTINFLGDFSLISGRIDENGSEPTQGNLRFIGAGTQNFLNTGTVTTHINWYISSATTLDVGTSPITGSPSVFQLDGTLVVGSVDNLGAIQSNTLRGNLRTPPSTRTYNSGSIVVYGGAGTQYMGNGQPTGALVTTVIDNPNDVLLAANVTINGTLSLEDGDFNLTNYTLTSGGTLQNSGGLLAGTPLSSLVIQGTSGGNWGTLSFNPSANTLGILTINRTGASASATVSGTLLVDSLLNLSRGDINNIAGLTMVDQSSVYRYNTANLTGTNLVAQSGSYHVVYRTFSPTGGPFANFATGLELPSDNTSLGNLTISTAQTADVVTLNQDITINGNTTWTRGTLRASTFTTTMQGSTWTDNTGNFDPGTGTVIFNGVTTAGGTSALAFYNLTLTPTGILSMTQNFTLSGNLNFGIGGTFAMSPANTMTFGGGNVQSVSANGATFSNVNVTKSGSAGINLTSTFNLSGLLQFATPSTNVNLASNGFLVLISTSDAAGTGTAMIYRLQSGNTVSGDVTVQRYMSGEGQIYRYLSSPVSGAMVSQWKDDFDITGPFLDPTPRRRICNVYTNPASYSLFYYDETVAGDENQGYVGYPLSGNATTNSPLLVGRGYAAFIRICNAPTIVDVTGPINQGQINLPVTYTANAQPTADGWNLVGNPYPCTIDWDLGTWTKTRISSMISITDNGSGMIRYYDPGVTNDIPNGQIAPGQAFFVRATAASPVLIIRENTKVGTPAEFFRERGPESIPSFALTFSDGVLTDRAYVKILDQAIPRLDEFDGPKISNHGFNFSTVSEDNKEMAINALGELPCNQEIKLSMRDVPAGDYKIGLESRRDYFSERHFILIDRFLNEEIELTSSNEYVFTVGDDSQSRDVNRFALKIELSGQFNIAVSAPKTVCQSSSPAVVIENSVPNASYSIFLGNEVLVDSVDGDGKDIQVAVGIDQLVLGANQITVRADHACLPNSQEVQVPIEFATPAVTWTDSEKQVDGSVVLSAGANIATPVFAWFESPEVSEPLHIGESFRAEGGVVYYVAVTLENGKCESGRVAVSSSQESLGVENQVRVFPNPTKGNLTVEVLDPRVTGIQITNVLGQMVSSTAVRGGDKAYPMDISSMPAGIYLIVIIGDNGHKTIRLYKE